MRGARRALLAAEALLGLPPGDPLADPTPPVWDLALDLAIVFLIW